MAEGLDRPLTQKEAWDLSQALKPLQRKPTDSEIWNAKQLALNEAIYRAYEQHNKKLDEASIPTAQEVADLLDDLADLLMESAKGGGFDPTSERAGEISDALNAARDLLVKT